MLLRKIREKSECAALRAEDNRMIRRYNKKRSQRGFTIMELLYVVLILSLLVAIAIPQFVIYRTRAFNAITNVAVNNAYAATQSFFSASPAGTVSVRLLSAYGYNANANIILILGGTGKMVNFTLQAVHSGGSSTFTIDQNGGRTRS
jgi:prepilin-type N-terminal cleavage/methylation domain-containing protein